MTKRIKDTDALHDALYRVGHRARHGVRHRNTIDSPVFFTYTQATMPAIIVTRLPGSEVKLELTIDPQEYSAYLEEGAKTLSQQRPVPGFRPGHVPMSEAKRLYGDMAILEASLERIVRAFYVKALLSEGIAAVGSPNINIDKLSPEQPLQFHAIVAVEPAVNKLADLTDCAVEQKAVAAKDEDVEGVLNEMRKMRRTESTVERAATKDDAITIDVEMKKDGVVIEGGTGAGYKVYLGEPHYLPSFTEQLLGMKAGDEKSFTINFPEDHYQKHLAGQEVAVQAKALGVHELGLPVVDDEFAKGVGINTAEELKAKLRENLTLEAEQKASEAAEIELLEKLIAGSDIEEAPEILVNEEVRRMLAELRHGVEEQGMKWEDYLSSIKKSMDDMRLELIPQAIKRIKTAVLIKHIAKTNNIEVTDTEVDGEIDRILSSLRASDKDMREHVSSADYRDYVHAMLRNRKTIEWLKSQCLKKTSS